MIDKTCEYCGITFSRPSWRQNKKRFCSTVCAQKFMYGVNSANWKGGNVERKCLFCEKEFFTKKAHVSKGKGLYCSKNCFDKARTKRTNIPCPTCGKIRNLRDSEINRGRFFCNQKCYRLHHPTSIESKIRNYLAGIGIEFIPEHKINRWSIDIFIPSQNLAIECDGDYWHKKTKDRDARKDKILREYGITVLRLTETDITKNMKYCEGVINRHLRNSVPY